MMGLGATLRRFAVQCLEVERDAGYFDKGRWQDCDPDTFTIQAGVQPAPPESIQRLPEGHRADGAKVLWPTHGSAELRTADAGDGGHNADRTTIDGQTYEIAAVERWPSHTRYIATRFGQ